MSNDMSGHRVMDALKAEIERLKEWVEHCSRRMKDKDTKIKRLRAALAVIALYR